MRLNTAEKNVASVQCSLRIQGIRSLLNTEVPFHPYSAAALDSRSADLAPSAPYSADFSSQAFINSPTSLSETGFVMYMSIPFVKASVWSSALALPVKATIKLWCGSLECDVEISFCRMRLWLRSHP
jgi:hypothetical protein